MKVFWREKQTKKEIAKGGFGEKNRKDPEGRRGGLKGACCWGELS